MRVLRFLQQLPLRLRLAVGYALFLVMTIAGVGLYLLASMDSSLQLESDAALRLRAIQVEREITSEGAASLDPRRVAAALADLAPLEEFSAPGIYVQVLDYQGAVLGSSKNLPGGWLPMDSDTVQQALGGHEDSSTEPAGEERVRLLARPVQSGDRVIGVVLVGESMHLLDVTLRRLRQALFVAAAGAALISILGGWWFTSRALGPIAAVTATARRIANTGQFQQRIPVPTTRDELGELVATFNEMLDRLEKTFRRQREFLADASHELRSPLMVIRGNLDLLKMNVPAEERRESAQDAAEEVERMARLVSDLLFLAEADDRELVERQPVALHEVVSSAWARAKDLDAEAHEIDLAHNDTAEVVGDRVRLDQMVWNLVENALRYTPSGGKVCLSLRNHGVVAELAISDTGIGIPAEHLPHIFDRFYRVDKSRSRHQGGTGLGLAIVRQVAEAHGGQVRVRSTPEEGTTFTVALPVLSS